MASNNDWVFFIQDETTLDPKTGVTPTWESLRNVSTGADVSADAPSISEVGGGVYKFQRPSGVHALAAVHCAGFINCQSGSLSPMQPVEFRPEELIDAVNLIGTPAGADVSADVAAVKAETAAIKAKTDNIPATPSSQADVTGARDSIKGTGLHDIADLYSRLGAPAGASLAADVASVKVDSAALSAQMARAMGLLHENSVLDNTSHDSLSNMTAGRLRIYDTKANAEAAGATGLLGTYSITATFVSGLLSSYTVVKEP